MGIGEHGQDQAVATPVPAILRSARPIWGTYPLMIVPQVKQLQPRSKASSIAGVGAL